MTDGSLILPEHIDNARNYLLSADAYTAFESAPHGVLVMSGCMDPRADDIFGQRHLTKVMGPGGAIGEAEDLAIARTAFSEELVTIEDGLEEDLDLRRAFIHGAHHGCAFMDNIAEITREQAFPSPLTKWFANGWIEKYKIGSWVTPERLGRVSLAAGVQHEHLLESGSVNHLLDQVNIAFPDHHNVPHMRGTATPHFYLINHYPTLGLDRHHMHDVHKYQAQAYHDNVRARLIDVETTHSIEDEVRYLRMGALILRSAATASVIHGMKINSGHPLEHWEIGIGRDGPVFERTQDEFIAKSVAV